MMETMQMYQKQFRFRRTDVWREGKWLDSWSVVHTFSGVSAGFLFYIGHFDAVESLALAFIIFIAYELWEAMVDIRETSTNRVVDVVVGIVSFAPTYFLLAPALSGAVFWGVFGVIFFINVAMAALGWIASRKAAVLGQRVRTRYAMERARLHGRTEKIRRKFRRK